MKKRILRAGAPIEKTCIFCGNTFVGYAKRKYCSNGCANRSRVAHLYPTPTTRICSKCGKERSLDSFYKHKGRRYTSWCKACQKKHQESLSHYWRDYRSRPDVKKRAREQQLKNKGKYNLSATCKTYSITVEEYHILVNESNGRCAICRSQFTKDEPCIDHNHSTGKIRGLLCGLCNRGLGCFRDRTDLLNRASEYLKRSALEAQRLHR